MLFAEQLAHLGRDAELLARMVGDVSQCLACMTFGIVVAVARQDASLTSWRATFPAVKARWVRLRVQKAELPDLARVRILR